MEITSTHELLEALKQRGLLEQAQITKLDSTGRSALQTGRDLVQRGWLTAFQLDQLLKHGGEGLLLGSYAVLEPLGAGGMGEVFRARHRKLGQIVALKVVRKERLSHPDAARRFRREIQALSQLSHPNIVRAFDADEADGVQFFAMEFVEGTDLARLIKEQGPLPISLACDCIRQAALALQHASERGLVHRDIKPSNLILTRKGIVKVLDLGLARLMATDIDMSASLTETGTVLGTPDFISPEQARNSRLVDIRADLYSLGCTLYFLLAGRVPFPGGNFTEKLLKHQLDEPEAIERLRPEVPANLSQVVRRLMAKKPEERYQTPAEVIAALIPFAKSQSATLPDSGQNSDPSGTVEYMTRSDLPVNRRRPWMTGIGIVGFIAVALVALLFLVPQTPDLDSPSWSLDRLNSSAIPPEERFPWQPPELVAVIGHHARRHWDSITCVAYSPDTKAPVVATGGPDGVIRLWDPVASRELEPLPGHDEAVTGLAFSADGRLLLSAGWDDHVRLWDMETRKQKQAIKAAPEPNMDYSVLHTAAVDRTGQFALTASWDMTIRLWDLKAGKEAHRFRGSEGVPNWVAFSPDGKKAVSSDGKAIRTWDLEKQQPALTFKKSSGRGIVAFTSDGRYIFSSGGAVEIWNPVKGTPIRNFPEVKDGVWPAFSPDQKRILGTCQDGRLSLWEFPSGKLLRQEKTGELRYPAIPVLSGDGKYAALLAADGQLRLWDAEQLRVLRTIVTGAPVRGLAFSPDGRQLVFASGENSVHLWDLEMKQETQRFDQPGTGSWHVGPLYVASDRVQFASFEETVTRIWNLHTGQEVGKLPVASPGVLVFTPDGRGVVLRDDKGLPRLFETTGTEIRTFPGSKNIDSLAISADGKLLLGGPGWTQNEKGIWIPGRDHAVRLWDIDSGKELARFEGHTDLCNAVAISPDSRLAVSGGRLGDVRVWDLETRNSKPLVTLSGHERRIMAIAFSPDGKRFASCCHGGKITVWDTATFSRLHHWKLPGGVLSLAFAPDGRHLAIGNGNGTVYILRLPANGSPTVQASSGAKAPGWE